MNRRQLLLVMGLTALVVGAMATSAAAQITNPPVEPPPTVPPAPVPVVPRSCYVAKYDLNGDHRVNDVDMNQWKRWFLEPECQQGAGTCHPGMDMDGDGVIEFADLDQMFQHYRKCLQMPSQNDLPQR